MSAADAPAPLDGIRVLDFSHMMQGPWAGEMLGDLGADVIKVEPPTGERGRQSGTVFVDGRSAQYLAMNKNKRSVCVDLKSPSGLELVLRLVDTADVVIENFRPGTMERLGLGYDVVAARNPGIVYCSATGYGTGVPDPGRAGQDLLAQARTGAMWLTGTADDPPVPCGPFVADIHGATMLALGATAALHARNRTGRGTHLEVDLVGAMLHMQVQEVSSRLNGGVEVARHSRPGSAFIEAPYGAYECADGRWLAISLTDGAQLAAALEVPSLATEFPTKAEATDQRDRLYEIVDRTVRTRPLQEWLDRFDAHGVWCAPVNDYEQMQSDPFVDWERRAVTVERDGRPVTLVANPLRFDGRSPGVRRPPPDLGEHTDEVLEQLGLGEQERKELFADGAVR